MNRRKLRKYKENHLPFVYQQRKGYVDDLLGGPYLLCVHLEAMTGLLAELHDGFCGNDTGGLSVAHKIC